MGRNFINKKGLKCLKMHLLPMDLFLSQSHVFEWVEIGWNWLELVGKGWYGLVWLGEVWRGLVWVGMGLVWVGKGW